MKTKLPNFKVGDKVVGLWFDFGEAVGVLVDDGDDLGLGFSNEDGWFPVEGAFEIRKLRSGEKPHKDCGQYICGC